MANVLAIIMAGGAGTRLSVLSDERSKPAVPFAGRYRIIDFTLSNCVNSGIYSVAVLTQYRPHSLMHHIGIGEPWDLNRRWPNGIQTWQPYRGRRDQVQQRVPRLIADNVADNAVGIAMHAIQAGLGVRQRRDFGARIGAGPVPVNDAGSTGPAAAPK